MSAFRTLDRLVAPLVSVISDGNDEFVFGNNFQRLLNVADKEAVTGDRSGFALRLVLVVIHKDEAVGVVGEVLVVKVVIIRGDVDVHLQSAGVEVGGHLAN